MLQRLATIIIVHVFLSTMPSAAIAQEETPPSSLTIEGIVAVVNDDPISFFDVRQRARLLLLSIGGQQPTQEQIRQLADQALDQLINEKLQLQEATEYEVEISDTEIDEAIDELARSSGLTGDGLRNMLVQSAIDPVSLEDQTRADIAWRRIIRGLYGSRIRISDNQIDEQLSHLHSIAEKEQYRVSEIFLYAPTDADKVNTLVAANSIIEQLSAGASFELAAQRFSAAATAATGGDMGWITLDDLDSDRRAAIQMVEDTGLAPPIQSENGVYILLVQDRRKPSPPQTRVDLTRISVRDESETALQAAIAKMPDCNAIDPMVADGDNLEAIMLQNININDFKPAIKSMIAQTQTGRHTDTIRQLGRPVVFYVCDRRSYSPNVPSREQIENRLFSEQFAMIAERNLRDLRRKATIIQR